MLNQLPAPIAYVVELGLDLTVKSDKSSNLIRGGSPLRDESCCDPWKESAVRWLARDACSIIS